MKLSRRLQLILEQVPSGSRIADIGSDHAMLPVAAVESGRAVMAVAGEVNPGPFDAATKQVAAAGLSHSISVRRGDGLQVISPEEVDVITIAGMGGGLITSILDADQDKLKGVSQLVLQPNVGEDILRRWLLEHHWVLISEMIIEEDHKLYEILTAVPEGSQSEGQLTNEQLYQEQTWQREWSGEPPLVISRDLLLQMGPLLLADPDPVLFEKWEGEITKLEGILASLSSSKLSSAEMKAQDIRKQIKLIQEVLACLQKDKQ
ncbi:tRNA (adenine(22)-N(1))-methyltransferase [Paenibacillus pini]|uniref:tRNA-m1A22 methylase n=1 Tax=Paenibacillus pini JCM 16418 TaxID=1236976 RepID=W7Y811_9BACL|nr:class I SAM-dependent methyltransferase [Paenibacillus pini]GAF07050.1 tRNA-m1A22 methylase [Paenibacillus pini JCM 16418]